MSGNPSGAYVGVASKSGRTGIALPLGGFTEIAALAMCVIIGIISLVIWPVMIFWHELCWGIMILVVARGIRKVIKAYNEGKNG